MDMPAELRRELEATRLLVHGELLARAVPRPLTEGIVMTGDHEALMDVIDADDAATGLSFIVGQISGLMDALRSPNAVELIDRERREFRSGPRAMLDEAIGETLAHADYVADALVDLDLIDAADRSHDLNFAYGRLAALSRARRLAAERGA